MIRPELRTSLVNAVHHLIKQDAFGFSHFGGCSYLTPEGNSCIVGLWAKHELGGLPAKLRGTVATCLESSTAAGVEFQALTKAKFGTLSAEERYLLSDMQYIHDKAGLYHNKVKQGLQNTLAEYGDQYPEATQIYMEALNDPRYS